MIGNDVHMDLEYMDKIITRHALNKNDAHDVFKKQFLSKNIINAFLEPEIPMTRKDEVWYKRTTFPESVKSIRVNPGIFYITNGYNFLLSDFYLICYKGHNTVLDSFSVDYKDTHTQYFKYSEEIYLIPLEAVEIFKIEFNEYNETYYNAFKRVDPTQRAINGACLGMILGGPAGAVFGANEFYKGASSRTETRVSRKNTYKLIIKFTNGDFIIIDDYWQTSGKENNKLNKMNSINLRIEKLLAASKLKLTDEEKRKRVMGGNFWIVFTVFLICMLITYYITYLIISNIYAL